MIKVLVFIILSGLFSVYGQTQQGNPKLQKAYYLGRWVGNPESYLEKLGFSILWVGAEAHFCLYGDSNSQDFIKKANRCLERFTYEYDKIITFCAEEGFTHYGIANLRISHSNVITAGGSFYNYGHFIIVYGDLFCAIERKR